MNLLIFLFVLPIIFGAKPTPPGGFANKKAIQHAYDHISEADFQLIPAWKALSVCKSRRPPPKKFFSRT